MDQLTIFGVVCAACAVGAAIGFFVFRYGELRAKQRIHPLLVDYFEGKIGVEELGRRARDTVKGRFLGGNEFFAEAVAAFQRAVDSARAKKRADPDEDKLVKLLAALRNEFGLTERYKIEGWRAGRE